MHRRKSTKYLILLTSVICLSLWISACGNQPAPNQGGSPSDTAAAPNSADRKLTDGMGNTVTIPANPQRIIASYLEDPLLTLGVKPVAQWSVANGSGVQDYLKDKLNGIPTIPSELPFEAVTGFNPDLMIIGSSSSASGEKYNQYAKIAPTFVLGDEINNDWRQALLKIGEVLGKTKEAQQALNDYDLKAKDAKEKLQKANGTQSAAAIWATPKALYVVSENLSSGAVLYKDLGFQVPSVVKEISSSGTANWRPISMERLATLDADHIFVIRQSGEDQLLDDPVWKSIPAVKNGHVYSFDKTHSWLYSGVIANSQMIDDVLKSLIK